MYKYILATFFMMFNVASEATHTSGSLVATASGHVISVASTENGILIGWDGDNAIHCNSNTVIFDKSRGETVLDRAFKIALTAQVTDEKISVVIVGCKGNFIDALVIRLCSDELCTSLPGAAFD